jgi:hypothetical protein
MIRRYDIVAICLFMIFSSSTVSIYHIITSNEETGFPVLDIRPTDRFRLVDLEDPDREIVDSLRLSGEYLVNHIEEDGSWDYLYDAGKDRSIDDYNLLRHAGTTYSMALIFKYTGDPRFYNGSVITANYMLENYLHFEEKDVGEIAYVSSGHLVKLGGAALAALALIQIATADPLVLYDREITGFGNFILNQITESGKFNCYMNALENKHNDYYPGEALLALTGIYEYTGDCRYLDGLNRSWEFYKDFYGSGGYTPFSPWGTEALYHTCRITGRADLADLALLMGRNSISSQIQPSPYTDERYIGGFGNPPRSNSASKVEAGVDAYALSLLLGEDYWIDVFNETISLARKFLLELQLNRSEADELPNPVLSRGGYPDTFDDLEIRIDYVQHSVVVLIKILAYRGGIVRI